MDRRDEKLLEHGDADAEVLRGFLLGEAAHRGARKERFIHCEVEKRGWTQVCSRCSNCETELRDLRRSKA